MEPPSNRTTTEQAAEQLPYYQCNAAQSFINVPRSRRMAAIELSPPPPKTLKKKVSDSSHGNKQQTERTVEARNNIPDHSMEMRSLRKSLSLLRFIALALPLCRLVQMVNLDPLFDLAALATDRELKGKELTHFVNNNLATKTVDEDDDFGGERPGLVLHIGPHKTGTTSIQTSLERFRSELTEEGYAIPPRIMGGPPSFYKFSNGDDFWSTHLVCHALFPKPLGENFRNETMAVFHKFLEESSEQNRTVLLSTECFASLFQNKAKILIDEWLAPFRPVHLVVAYRQLHSWLWSAFTELYKDNRDLQFSDFLRGQIKHEKRTFSEAVVNFMPYVDTIHVINYEDKSIPLLEQFFCLALPNGSQSKACQKLRQEANETAQVSANRGKPMEYFEYQNLVKIAKKQGIIQDDVDREVAVKHAAKYIQNLTKFIPIGAMPHENCVEMPLLEKLWNMTLANEEDVARVSKIKALEMPLRTFASNGHHCALSPLPREKCLKTSLLENFWRMTAEEEDAAMVDGWDNKQHRVEELLTSFQTFLSKGLHCSVSWQEVLTRDEELVAFLGKLNK
ncbi:expressed unknown protein [Seminavis robusta]|uniref:Sulfotransferase domain-containing protein n=1 Tax=Seminavis robusta TaxID=568900 RepID=A0A9N8HLG7_9STRA|nr:expressed unknown protein [Seminavis robusta]|eukprot:Sro682_g186510.1 n/a (565) ;mRNA; r:34357-36152